MFKLVPRHYKGAHHYLYESFCLVTFFVLIVEINSTSCKFPLTKKVATLFLQGFCSVMSVQYFLEHIVQNWQEESVPVVKMDKNVFLDVTVQQ